MANETTYNIASSTDFVTESAGYFTDLAAVGNISGDSTKGAFRFLGINIGQGVTVNSASLYFYNKSQGGGSGNLKFKTYGIKETNTGGFGSNPFGRAHTTAFDSADNPLPGNGNYKQITVTSIVNEILAQGGWSSGNAMGFLCENDGSNSNVYISDEDGVSVLAIRVSALPNFTPTPKSQTSGALPAPSDFGISIAKPGQDVRSATEEQLYFTTRKNCMKVYAEGSTSCTANVEKLIAHNLGYTPQVIAFAQGGGKSFKLPRFFASATDPIGGGLEGDIKSDSTYLRITVFQDSDVYYYIFLDEQAT
jgi:hypothetical protein